MANSREQECELKIHSPIRPIPWGNDIGECLDRGAHRLLSDSEYLAEPATHRTVQRSSAFASQFADMVALV